MTARTWPLTRPQRRTLRSGFVHAALVSIIGALSLPFVWMISTSFKYKVDMLKAVPEWIPSHPTLANYQHILFETAFPTYFKNSLIVALGTSFAAVLITSFAAYALSRYEFRAKGIYILFILTSQMFPSALFLAPLFLVLKQYHLINALPGLILAYATFVVPFTTWLLKGYFDTIPIELEEAALTEGANRWQALFLIVVPLASPGMAATVLFAFLHAWQEFLFAFTYIQSDRLRTLPPAVGLTFAINLGAEYGSMMVMSALITLPVVILFVFLQRFIVQGLTAGAIKG
jgi:multiple sugar transport system permease protein